MRHLFMSATTLTPVYQGMRLNALSDMVVTCVILASVMKELTTLGSLPALVHSVYLIRKTLGVWLE